jgi:hypothetical protein
MAASQAASIRITERDGSGTQGPGEFLPHWSGDPFFRVPQAGMQGDVFVPPEAFGLPGDFKGGCVSHVGMEFMF